MTTSRNPNIAILGATGAVGQEFIRLIEERGAAPDHPVNPCIPETEYLKFFLLQII